LQVNLQALDVFAMMASADAIDNSLCSDFIFLAPFHQARTREAKMF
jgi:hypothetical protein